MSWREWHAGIVTTYRIGANQTTGIKTEVGRYYAMAAEQYADEAIKTPWDALAEASIAF